MCLAFLAKMDNRSPYDQYEPILGNGLRYHHPIKPYQSRLQPLGAKVSLRE